MSNLFEWVNGSVGKQQLLIIMCVFLIFATVGPFGISMYQMIKFKKMTFEKSFVTKWLLGLIYAMLAFSLIFSILEFVFYYGKSILPNDSNLALTLVIVFIAFNAALALATYLILIFANQYVAIGISKDFIYIFGDMYPTDKVISLVHDGKVLSLHIGVGKRVVKRIKFSAVSMCGQCLQSAAPLVGLTITEGNDKEIFISEVQKRQEEFRNSLTKISNNQKSSINENDKKNQKEEEKKED